MTSLTIERVEKAPFLRMVTSTEAAAVDMDDVRLGRGPVAHVGDVAHVDGGAVHDFHRKIVELFGRAGRVVQANGVLVAADLGVPRGRDLGLGGDGGGDVLRRKALRLQGQRIEVELDLTLASPRGQGNRHSRHRDQGSPHLVEGEVVEPAFGDALAREGQLQDGHGGRVVVEDERRVRARRKLPQHGLRHRRHLRGGGADVGSRLEEDLDDPDALE